ncbi:hypothetical protein [Streptomyces guryensis]|uniref:Uncharacterized protein n=1 Tax=Streptomyces guryensis TaxID=2886947 RepID=A0A9Q3Z6X3_9ACTN|nr:hypothetical protein [Streptomyces guryensis]MCD9875714.1 hypothetical protein [Streptomyces guryensis]
MRTRRSNLVGVLFPRLPEIVVATIDEGAEEEATLRGLSTFVTDTHDAPHRRASPWPACPRSSARRSAPSADRPTTSRCAAGS